MNRDYKDKYNQQDTKDRERITGTEDTIEEIDALNKENSKSNKFLAQNIQELWDTMKRTNLRIIGIDEKLQIKGTENIFNKIRRKLSQRREDHAYENTRSL